MQSTIDKELTLSANAEGSESRFETKNTEHRCLLKFFDEKTDAF
jgi:hypothetical protein